MDEREDKQSILDDYITKWFNKQEDIYQISQEKLKEDFIFEEFFLNCLTLKQLKENNLIYKVLDKLYNIQKDFVDFQLNYLDNRIFKKPISEEKKQEKIKTSNGYINTTDIAIPKDLNDMLLRAKKVYKDMEANHCNTNELKNYIRALNKAITHKKGLFPLQKYKNEIKYLIQEELEKKSIPYKKFDLNECIKNLTQQYLKNISSERIDYNSSNLPKNKSINFD